jgi:hypothetical protein
LKKIQRHIICEKDVGLFSLIQQVISHIPLALSTKKYPVVLFGKNCSYWTKQGYKEKTNVWEYYFEPIIKDKRINSLSKPLLDHINNHPPLHKEIGYFFNDDTFISNNFGNHNDFKGKSLTIPFKWKDPDKDTRVIANEIIKKYIIPRKYILAKSDLFFKNFMENQQIIGVHIRSTDICDLQTEYNLYRRYSYIPKKFIKEVSRLVELAPKSKIFVATDNQNSLDMMLDSFPNQVIYYSSIFQKAEPYTGHGAMGWKMPGYLTKNQEIAAKNGEEAIIDYLLLSKCNFLIHNGSSLARTVLLNKPNLNHINVHSRNNYLKHLIDPSTFEFYYFCKIMIQKGIWWIINTLKVLI